MTANNRLVQQAKSGDPDAIAQLLNRQLEQQGIHTEVTVVPDGLAIAVSKLPQAPPRQATITYLTSAFRRLDAPSIQSLEVSGWQTGANQATWQQTIVLRNNAITPPSPPPPNAPAPASPQSSPTSQSAPQGQTKPTPSAAPTKTFNSSLFRLGWLFVTVPFVWLYFWMPQVLYRLDSTGDNPWQYWYDNQQWMLIIPLAIGQWWLLRRHVRSAYWWEIAVVIVFYLETYPRGLLSHALIRLVHTLLSTLTPVLDWSPNAIRGFAIGLLLGVSQWLLLRRSLHPPIRTAHWIWISAIAWALGLGLPILTNRFMPNFFAISPRLFWPVAEVLHRLSTGIGPFLLAVITGGVLAYWLKTAPAD